MLYRTLILQDHLTHLHADGCEIPRRRQRPEAARSVRLAKPNRSMLLLPQV